MICENCKKEHDGSYGSGRFCSTECARGFATKAKRKEINEKVSKKLKGIPTGRRSSGYVFTKEDRKKGELVNSKNKLEEAFNLLELGQLAQPKRIRKVLLIKQNGKCSICGMESVWNGNPLVLEVDHIDGNPENNDKKNLRLICPNCHSQTPTFRGRNNGTGNRSYMKKYYKTRKKRN